MCKDVRMIETPMVAREGLLIAHDLLEHQYGLKAIGSVGDELVALGGVWFVRGEWSDLSRDGQGNMYSAEENLARDAASLAGYYANGCSYRMPVPRTRRHDCDDAFHTIIDVGMRGMDPDIEVDPQFWTDSLHFLRHGYNLAKRRFGDIGKANQQFWAIAKAVDPRAKHAEHVGQEFRLRYGGGYATCEEVERDYW
jgi:hypothetical protein